MVEHFYGTIELRSRISCSIRFVGCLKQMVACFMAFCWLAFRGASSGWRYEWAYTCAVLHLRGERRLGVREIFHACTGYHPRWYEGLPLWRRVIERKRRLRETCVRRWLRRKSYWERVCICYRQRTSMWIGYNTVITDEGSLREERVIEPKILLIKKNRT